MSGQFNKSIPIYTQLVEIMTHKIISGQYKPGEKLDSVRDLAKDVGVNPNTMQRALSELERMELLYTERTSGRYVTKDVEVIKNVKNEIFAKKIADFTNEMIKLGCDVEWIKEEVNKAATKISKGDNNE